MVICLILISAFEVYPIFLSQLELKQTCVLESCYMCIYVECLLLVSHSKPRDTSRQVRNNSDTVCGIIPFHYDQPSSG